MGDLLNTATNEVEFVPDGMVGKALASKRYVVPAKGASVPVADINTGQIIERRLESGQSLPTNVRVADPGETVGAARPRILEEEYSGPYDQLVTGLTNVAQGASLGTYGLANRAVGFVDPAEMRRQNEANPDTALYSDALGTVLPALATGGGALGAEGAAGTVGTVLRATPAGAAAGVAEKIAARGVARGGAAEGAGAILGGAAEGGLFGLGEGAKELGVTEDPMTIELAASTLSSNFFTGAGVGGATGLVAKGLEKGLERGARVVDDYAARMRMASGVEDEFSRMNSRELVVAQKTEQAALDADRKAVRESISSEYGVLKENQVKWREKEKVELDRLQEGQVARRTELRAEREAEKARLDAERVEEAARVGDDIHRFDAERRESKYWHGRRLTAPDELGKRAASADMSLVRSTDNIKGLRQNPRKALDALQREEQTIVDILADQRPSLGGSANRATREHFRKNAEALLPKNQALQKKIADLDRPLTSPRLDEIDAELPTLQAARGALSSPKLDTIREGIAGPLTSPRLEKLKELARSPLDSPRMAAIKQAREALAQGGGFGQQLLRGGLFSAVAGAVGSVPGLGIAAPIVGAYASQAVSDFVFRRMGKASGVMAERIAKAIGAVMDDSKRVLRIAPVAATKTLSAVRFGAEKRRKEGERETLLNAYRARADELRAQTTVGPDGKLVMRPDARRVIADGLRGVTAMAPKLADGLETTAARRIEFLANKLPKRPDIAVFPIGPDHWRPSDFDMATFARYVAAVEDPGGVLERLASGGITPEDAEAFRTVYPEMYQQARNEILRRLPEVQKAMPYARRLGLSIFFDAPVDPAMQPEIISTLQGSFDDEPGTEGGAQAPAALPQLGSVEKSLPEPTPAQSRAG